jgi:hypothetical protein
VCEVEDVDFIPFDRDLHKKKGKAAEPYIEKLEKYLCEGFYFGFETDLTRSLQM